jgi:hypothetical protein
METRPSRRTGLILAAAAVLAVVVIANLRRRRVDAAPPRAHASAAPSNAVVPPTARAVQPAAAEARRARDAMRAQILEAQRRRAAAAATASPPPPLPVPRGWAAPPPEEPVGHYEPSYIRQVVREDMFPLVRQCYESALERRPQLAGKLVLSFAIEGDPDVGGIVDEADFAEGTTLQDEEMETCVRESFMTLTFDKPPSGGGRVTVKYPIEFAPGEEEAKDGGKG